jgi:transaldolase/glucose-6-phosphate isomerase
MYSAHDLLTRWPALNVAARRARLQDSLRLTAGPLADIFSASTPAAERVAGALWLREPSAWSGDASEQRAIANRLGWMSSPFLMADSIERLNTFAAAIRRNGFTDVVLLGMGGSSLAPEVLRAILGVAAGWPRFRMLDSTDPAAVRAAATPPSTTLYLLSSKSGTTIEPNSLAAHFRRQLEEAGVARWADHFVGITDEGTELARRARADGFRDVFINPSDIGGRYSALSFFGLVPAALMGLDIAALVGWGLAMLAAAEPGFGTAIANPATALGLAIGAGARAGRDKLTLIVPPQLEPFGLWVEQLIAESTGKKGSGVVPIAGEHVADPSTYGSDRLFVRINGADRLRVSAPVVDIELTEPTAIGAEFVRWEIATAVAGGLLHINPFDEPNVQQAKDATRKLLDQYKATGRLPAAAPDRTLDGTIALTVTAAARRYLGERPADAILTLLRKGDYFALLAYLGPDPTLADELNALRQSVAATTHAATMFAYGPRYLHSTGQLHKGGPNTGVFILISATPDQDVPIPGEPFSFGTLEHAQALGDFASLDATERRGLHAHLPSPDSALLRQLAERLLAALRDQFGGHAVKKSDA